MEVTHNSPQSHSLPSLPRPPSHSCDLLLPKKEKEKKDEKKYQVLFVLPIYLMEHAQIPSGQPIKENSVLSHQKSSAMKNYTLGSLVTMFRILFNGFLSRLFLFVGTVRGRERYCQRNLLCLLFSTVSLQLSMLLQKKLPCFLQLAAVWIIDFQMISGDSVDHRHPHGLRHQQDQGPQHRL